MGRAGEGVGLLYDNESDGHRYIVDVEGISL